MSGFPRFSNGAAKTAKPAKPAKAAKVAKTQTSMPVFSKLALASGPYPKFSTTNKKYITAKIANSSLKCLSQNKEGPVANANLLNASSDASVAAAKPANLLKPLATLATGIESSQSVAAHLPPPKLVPLPTEPRTPLTLEQLMAIPLRPCLQCARYSLVTGYCDSYRCRMPFPARPCRCLHYRLRGVRQ